MWKKTQIAHKTNAFRKENAKNEYEEARMRNSEAVMEMSRKEDSAEVSCCFVQQQWKKCSKILNGIHLLSLSFPE